MIHHGDLFDVLPMLPEASIDACVTDPPYELSFMGKHWDGSGVAFQQKTWAEVYRVLKPGAHLLAFGGTRTFHRMTCAIEDAGFEIRDCLSWLYGQGFPKSLNIGEGRGTALKPAWEPIILARKPLKGSVAANVLAHGTGALNVDACRIATSDSLGGGAEKAETVCSTNHEGWDRPWKHNDEARAAHAQRVRDAVDKAEALGRWPANVLLDEEAAGMLDEQSGERVSGGYPQRRNTDKFRSIYGAFKGSEVDPKGIGASSGGASRFFYCPKPSAEERNTGIDCNGHPTVKPIELMRWLVKLVTPIDGTVLDPFTGSGTTGMACAYELRRFIGIEREAEYVAIAERRISACVPLFGEHTA